MSLGIVASARRDTSFSVLALPSLTGWWDADDASTFTYSSGVVVSQWSDKSGGANHLSVIDGTAPPFSATVTPAGSAGARAFSDASNTCWPTPVPASR